MKVKLNLIQLTIIINDDIFFKVQKVKALMCQKQLMKNNTFTKMYIV